MKRKKQKKQQTSRAADYFILAIICMHFFGRVCSCNFMSYWLQYIEHTIDANENGGGDGKLGKKMEQSIGRTPTP
jgi:hypothetical protein